MSAETPLRVVRRIRGKKMPPNTKYVGRGSKLGNQYHIPPYTRQQAVDLYEVWLREKIAEAPNFLDEYRGVNHACWCHDWDGLGPNPRYCHADITLEIAMEKTPL